MAKKSGLYSDVADTEFSKLEKEHFKEEFEMLGDAASDITGTGYLKLPVAVADMKPLRHYHP